MTSDWTAGFAAPAQKETQGHRPRWLRRFALGALIVVGFGGLGFGLAAAFGGGTPSDAQSGTAPKPAAPVVVGTVATVAADKSSFTLKTRSGSVVTVAISGATTYVTGRNGTGSMSDLTPGALVSVVGEKTGASTVSASRVSIGFGGFHGGSGFGSAGRGFGSAGGGFGTVGQISKINASAMQFTVEGRGGTTFTIKTSSATTYAAQGGSSVTGGLSGLKVGEVVVVSGTTTNSTVDATRVLVFAAGFRPGNGRGGGFGARGGGFGSLG